MQPRNPYAPVEVARHTHKPTIVRPSLQAEQARLTLTLHPPYALRSAFLTQAVLGVGSDIFPFTSIVCKPLHGCCHPRQGAILSSSASPAPALPRHLPTPVHLVAHTPVALAAYIFTKLQTKPQPLSGWPTPGRHSANHLLSSPAPDRRRDAVWLPRPPQASPWRG